MSDAPLNLSPFGLRNDDRKQVEGPRPIHTLCIAVHIVDDAVLADDFFCFPAIGVETLNAGRSEGIHETSPVRPDVPHAV